MTPTHAPDSLLADALTHAHTRAHAEAQPQAIWERRHAWPNMVTSAAVLLEEARTLMVKTWGSPQPAETILLMVVTGDGQEIVGDEWQEGDAYVCSSRR